MKPPVTGHQFFTVAIYKWRLLLQSNEYKDIIISCLKFLKSWQPTQAFALTKIQTSFYDTNCKGD